MLKDHIPFLILSWLYLAISFALVANRVYVRVRHLVARTSALSNFSDGLVALAWLFNLSLVIGFHVACARGAMPSNQDLMMPSKATPEQLALWVKINYIQCVTYYPTLYCIKIAILCFLLDVTPSLLPGIKLAIRIGFGLCALGLLYTVLAYIFACRPVRAGWDYFTKGDCTYYGLIASTGICYHIVMDFYIYCIPLFLLRHLKIVSKTERAGAYAMFGLGFLLVGIGFTQIMQLYQHVMWSQWWSIHEMTLALLVACLPALRVTILHVRRASKKLPISDPTTAINVKARRFDWGKLERGDLTTREVTDFTRTECSMIDVQEADYKATMDVGTDTHV